MGRISFQIGYREKDRQQELQT